MFSAAEFGKFMRDIWELLMSIGFNRPVTQAVAPLNSKLMPREKEPAKQSQPHSPQEHTFSGNLIWTSHLELRCYSVTMRGGP
jgi:hypothetical protein